MTGRARVCPQQPKANSRPLKSSAIVTPRKWASDCIVIRRSTHAANLSQYAQAC
jgi:hypothetical protein